MLFDWSQTQSHITLGLKYHFYNEILTKTTVFRYQ